MAQIFVGILPKVAQVHFSIHIYEVIRNDFVLSPKHRWLHLQRYSMFRWGVVERLGVRLEQRYNAKAID